MEKEAESGFAHRGACPNRYEAEPSGTGVAHRYPSCHGRKYVPYERLACRSGDGFRFYPEFCQRGRPYFPLPFARWRRASGFGRYGIDMAELTAGNGKRQEIRPTRVEGNLASCRAPYLSGPDNPIANLLAAGHLRYDRFRIAMSASPDEGLNADMRLYGLRTDSLRLDTIFFDARQDTARFLSIAG